MFGAVWPIKQWAGVGAIAGGLYQLVQVVNQGLFSQGNAYVSGRVLGGLVMGAFFGALTAFIRNRLKGRG